MSVRIGRMTAAGTAGAFVTGFILSDGSLWRACFAAFVAFVLFGVVAIFMTR
jgi:hypothetical protein